MRIALAICVLGLAGCASDWESTDAQSRVIAAEDVAEVFRERASWAGADPLPEDESKIVEGRWHLVTESVFEVERAPAPGARSKPVLITPPVQAPVARMPAPKPARPALPVPKRRATPKPPKRGTKSTKTVQQLEREHYLDNPTTVHAHKITFYCPAAFLREVRLTADDVKETSADRRIARGGARLLCRELTLVADQITLRIRREADAELQVIARGEVDFISRVRNQSTHDEGLKSLILRQDRVIPLR